MKIIGITGNVGSGKSTVDKYISQQYGIPLIDVDLVAKAVIEKNKYQLLDFGKNNLQSNGEINFDAVFRNVFYDEEKIRRYRSWIHPLVLKEVERQLRIFRENREVDVIISAALIFEARIKTDMLILVDCPEEIRQERIKLRSKDERSHIRALRLDKLQIPSRFLHPYCDYIINNGGDFEKSTVPQIKQIIQTYSLLEELP